MLARLVLLFVTVPLLELVLLVWIGERIGLAATVALVMVTGVLGASLARWQGLATLARFQRATAQGRLPHREIAEGLLILVAAAVLLTPGLLTDLTGFLLLLPPVRRRAAAAVMRWAGTRMTVVTPAGRPAPSRPAGGPGEPGGEAIDVDFTVRDAADGDRG
jgi:UPF0716 protein FxsA